MTVHSFSTQYNIDNLPSYLQTNITAQMLSIGGEGQVKDTKQKKEKLAKRGSGLGHGTNF